MINDLPKYMLVSLVCTIIFEVIFAYILKVRKGKDFINIVLVNILTNPIVVSTSFTINVKYGLLEKRIYMIFIELLVVLVEGFIYSKCLEKGKPYKLSLLLNLCSYLLGFIVIYLEGVFI